MAQHRRHRSKGFTLIEVLVALLVAALISAMSYRGFSAMLSAEQKLDEAATRWLAVHRFFAQFEADARGAIAKGGRDPGGSRQPALLGLPVAAQPYDAQLVMTRSNAAQTTAQPPLQRIGYRLHDQRVELLLWPAVDLAPHGAATVIPLLDGVAAFRIRYAEASGLWRENWPPVAGDDTLPRGIEIELTMLEPSFAGPIVRVFPR